MGFDRGCNSCDRKRSTRRVEVLVQARGGGLQAITVRLCGSCLAALIDSITLYAVTTELLLTD